MMKKIYTKPMIVIEDFSMSTSIAAGCDKKTDNPTEGKCAYIATGDIYIFNSNVAECDFIESDDEYDGFCYHIPSEYGELFNS